eukprot:TRINITY_DN9226_c0_g1_i7.p1 TRINITY_DN9226_c0_g1~~TRINITY_DN9226_c0_g1_i7.p1  ORF type:complete len:589 (-),score=116.25 TRINITY_DN9226_c0_g1_i7:240-2006(-)
MGNKSSVSRSSSRPADGLNVPAAQVTGASQKHKAQEGAEDIRQKYDLGQVLGSGSFGQVREARLRAFPDLIRAAKIVEKDDEAIAEGEWSNSAMFRQEVALLQNLEHGNIVRFWDVYEDMHFLYIVMDICKGGEVFTKLLELKRFNEAHAAMLGSQMLAAIEYIHGKSIMHRDLKAENFLLSDSSPTAEVKLIDFGMAVKFEPGASFTSLCGSPHYLAPEVIGQEYDHRADMWAFGVLMHLMLYGQYPYDAKSHREIMIRVISGPPKVQKRTKLAPTTLDFLQGCLKHSKRKRLSATDALQHRFIISAAEPDEEPHQEANGSDLTEAVRSALQQLSTSRRPVDMEADRRRNSKLGEIEIDFLNGICLGQRLGQTPHEDFMKKPEFLRRDNRLTSAPSAAVNKLMERVAKGKDAIVNKVADRCSSKLQKLSKDEYADVSPDSKVEASAVGRAFASEPESRRKQRVQSDRLMYMNDLTPDDEAELKKAWCRWRKESKESKITSSCEPIAKMLTSDDSNINQVQRTRSEEYIVGGGACAEVVGKSGEGWWLRDARGATKTQKKSSGSGAGHKSQFDALVPMPQDLPHALPS